MSQGRPTAISDAMTDKDVLSLHHSTGVPSTSPPSLPPMQIWRLYLARMQNRFCNLMHKVDTVKTRLEALGELDAELVRLRDSLPSECRPEQEILVSPDKYSHVLLFHLEYYDLVRSIHWASITQTVISRDDTAELPIRMRSSEGLCLAAARSFIKTLNE